MSTCAGDDSVSPPPPPPLPVTVIDAGVGNLGNVARALAHVGAAVTVTRDARQVAAAMRELFQAAGGADETVITAAPAL